MRKITDNAFDRFKNQSGKANLSFEDLYIAVLLVYNDINKHLSGPHFDPPSKEKVRAMILTCDIDLDGGLDREEFALFMQKMTGDTFLYISQEAIGRARRGEGPTLVDCETYRFRGHSLADPDELRDPAEKAHYAARDPIAALKKNILKNKLASEVDLKAVEEKINEEIEEAVEFANASPPSRSQLLENVFADPKGFGIGPDGSYRCEDPIFTEDTAHV